MAANSCESRARLGKTLTEIRKDSQAFAEPETRANAGDSRDSQDSQGVEPVERSQSRERDVLARLLRWGWPVAEAVATAARIALREPSAIAASCVECAHYWPGRCGRHRQALLSTPEVGRDLAHLTQNCPAYTGLRETQEPRQ